MKNKKLAARLSQEVLDFIETRKTLQLASLTEEGAPFASYAPFAIGENCLYVLLSDLAVHAVNLKANPKASVLIIEDEDTAGELFARVRVNYSIEAECIRHNTEAWDRGISALKARHGERISHLSQLSDFRLFKLNPTSGRFVKGFAKAYSLAGNSLAGEEMSHMTDGHKKSSVV